MDYPQITPSVGRKVWFYENDQQSEPLDATVIKVWGDTPSACVNLFVVDGNGAASARCSVQPQHVNPTGTHYRWMPYQLGQAAKHSEPKNGTAGA